MYGAASSKVSGTGDGTGYEYFVGEQGEQGRGGCGVPDLHGAPPPPPPPAAASEDGMSKSGVWGAACACMRSNQPDNYFYV